MISVVVQKLEGCLNGHKALLFSFHVLHESVNGSVFDWGINDITSEVIVKCPEDNVEKVRAEEDSGEDEPSVEGCGTMEKEIVQGIDTIHFNCFAVIFIGWF